MTRRDALGGLAANAFPGGSPLRAPETAGERRRRALAELLQVLPPTNRRITGRISAFDKSWEDWLKRTGELPPDFSALPCSPFSPDPLTVLEGGRTVRITTPGQWQARKAALRAQFEQWVFGRMPAPPSNLRSATTASVKLDGVEIRDVRLEFGPGHKAALRLQLMIPPGRGPFPVFLTNHGRTSPWSALAVRRGYLGCIYFAADPIYGQADDTDGFIEAFPEYDFSCLARWAWAGMRAVDYLRTVPEADEARIGIAGHSRNGKQALLAAAFDERIAAVVASSGNTGECNPWRYAAEQYGAESLEQITRVFPHWFHPRLRFFAGRENCLPVDQDSLMALIAPRGLMMYAGYAEANPVGFEQAYRSLLRVYGLLGRPDRVWLNLRDGDHDVNSGDIEIFLDFFDSVFGRRTAPKRETWIHGYTLDNWRSLAGQTVRADRFAEWDAGERLRSTATPAGWEKRKAEIGDGIRWALGEEPPGVPFPPRPDIRAPLFVRDGWRSLLFRRPYAGDFFSCQPLPFGDNLKADFYHPGNDPAARKWPVAVWLHPFTYAHGYSTRAYSELLIHSLIRRGFAVLAFDQIGCGARVREARPFYERYPRWSLMGKMVADTRAAVAAVSGLEIADSGRIFLFGYSLGGRVGLLTAALEPRVAALAVVSAMDAWRTGTPGDGVDSLSQYSRVHGLLPRLAAFEGQPRRVPFDFDEVLAMVAPRPALIVAPSLDQDVPVTRARQQVAAASAIYRLLGRDSNLHLETPLEFNRLSDRVLKLAADWLEKQVRGDTP